VHGLWGLCGRLPCGCYPTRASRGDRSLLPAATGGLSAWPTDGDSGRGGHGGRGGVVDAGRQGLAPGGGALVDAAVRAREAIRGSVFLSGEVAWRGPPEASSSAARGLVLGRRFQGWEELPPLCPPRKQGGGPGAPALLGVRVGLALLGVRVGPALLGRRVGLALLGVVAGLALLLGCGPRQVRVLSHTPTPSVALTSPGTSAGLPQVSPSPSASPTGTPLPTSTLKPTAVMETEEADIMVLTIVYDNNDYDPSLQTAWGFSCLVETGETTILFDTGGDASTLLDNMERLGIDPQAIDAVVLSHIHGDHTGGLLGLLEVGVRPGEDRTVYVPLVFPASFKEGVRAYAELVEVEGPLEISPGIYTTGQVGSGIVEQALAVETGEGLVVVTGCAHPGIVEMVRRAKEVVGGEEGDVALVVGGFHLGSASQAQIERIVADFRRLGVRRVAPCHCTGDRARRAFADEFGPDCILAGVGKVLTVGSEREE